jgi:hypothetical protein
MQVEQLADRVQIALVGVQEVEPEEAIPLAQVGDALAVDVRQDVHGARP